MEMIDDIELYLSILKRHLFGSVQKDGITNWAELTLSVSSRLKRP
jgi:hypothetical protein